MSTNTHSLPNSEAHLSNLAPSGVHSSFFKRPFGLGNRSATTADAAELVPKADPARYSNTVCYADFEADLDQLIDNAIASIIEGDVVDDEILGHYVQIASLVRAVSFREGKLLEQAVEMISKANPNLAVLSQSIRLPLVKAALEAVSANDWSQLEQITLDSESPSKGSYTPDLIIVNRAKHVAFIIDLKRSLASYGDTTRLEELKSKMMATALILPDWLYKSQKRIMVDTVGVAIVDGASRPSDHASGIWALNEIDDLLEVDGAATAMMELRMRFGLRVREVLGEAARKAIGVPPAGLPTATSDTLTASNDPVVPARRPVNLNIVSRAWEREQLRLQDDDWYPDSDDNQISDDENDDEEARVLPFRIQVGFARKLNAHQA